MISKYKTLMIPKLLGHKTLQNLSIWDHYSSPLENSTFDYHSLDTTSIPEGVVYYPTACSFLCCRFMCQGVKYVVTMCLMLLVTVSLLMVQRLVYTPMCPCSVMISLLHHHYIISQKGK